MTDLRHLSLLALIAALGLAGCVPTVDDDDDTANDDDATSDDDDATSDDDDSAGDDDDSAGDDDDTTPPPTIPEAASDLAGTHNAPAVDLTWTDNAENETGFRIERSITGFDDWSEVGLADADATGWSDTTIIGGPVDYRVTATNDVGDASASNVITVDVAYEPQLAQITLDPATGTITVVSQPTHLVLTPSGAATDDGALTYTLPIDVGNGHHRVLFALKSVSRTVTAGSIPGMLATLYDGSPFVDTGLQGLDVFASRAFTMNVLADTATDLVTIDLEFINNPVLFGTDSYYGGDFRAFDASGTGGAQGISLAGLNWGGEYGNTPLRGVVSADGRTAWYGNRNQPAVLTLDLLTFTFSVSDTLISGGAAIAFDETGDVGFVRAVSQSPDGQYLYASLVTGAHTYEGATSKNAAGAGTLEIVKLEIPGLTEVGRLVVVDDVDEAMLKEVSLSADGSRGVVAPRVYNASYGEPIADVHGKIYVFDTATMALVPGPTTDAFDVSSIGVTLPATALSPDGTQVYFAAMPEDTTTVDTLQVLTVADGVISAVAGSPSSPSNSTDLQFGPDGRLYWGKDQDPLSVYDPSSDTWATLDLAGETMTEGWSVEFSGDSYYIVDHEEERGGRFLLSNDTLQPTASDSAALWIPMLGANASHAELVTPF